MKVSRRMDDDALYLAWDDSGGICTVNWWTSDRKWWVRMEPGLPFGGVSYRCLYRGDSNDGIYMGLHWRRDGSMVGGYTIVVGAGVES